MKFTQPLLIHHLFYDPSPPSDDITVSLSSLADESEGLLTEEVHDLVEVVEDQREEESKDLLTERHKGNISL